VVTPVTQTSKTQAQAEADLSNFDIQRIIDSMNGDSNKPTSTTGSSKSLTKLTKPAARALLEKTAKDAQYNFKFTDVDLNDFLTKFNAEQNKQIENVVKSTNVTPGASTDEIKRQVENTVTTEFPSYFKPEIFAADYVWAKVNFKDEKSLGGKALTALNNVRSILSGFGPLDFSDIEIQNAAKQIARGEITNDDFRSTIALKAMVNYPQYAQRLKENPGSTIRDLASPYINLMAKELELDPNTIQLDNVELDRALRPDGTAGKLPTVSLADFRIKLRNSPQWENTTAANESARSAATSIGRAFGYGV
jgi:hypothetical protein